MELSRLFALFQTIAVCKADPIPTQRPPMSPCGNEDSSLWVSGGGGSLRITTIVLPSTTRLPEGHVGMGETEVLARYLPGWQALLGGFAKLLMGPLWGGPVTPY